MIEVMQKAAPTIQFRVQTKESVFCRECVEMWNSRNEVIFRYRYSILSALHNFEPNCLLHKKIVHYLNGTSSASDYRFSPFASFFLGYQRRYYISLTFIRLLQNLVKGQYILQKYPSMSEFQKSSR